MQKRNPSVQLRKGIARWYYVVKGGNGQVLSTSEKYFSRSNAERAAVAFAKENDYVIGQKAEDRKKPRT